jgi:thioredoxin-like negative regulator of GroEL
LQKKYETFDLLKIEAEKYPDITEKYDITSVPSFLIFENGELIERVEGASPKEILQKLEKHKFTVKIQKLEDKLKELINKADVMLFMKGKPYNFL